MSTLLALYLLVAGLAVLTIVALNLRRRDVAHWPIFVVVLAGAMLVSGLIVAGLVKGGNDVDPEGVIEARRSIVFPSSGLATTEANAEGASSSGVEVPALIPTATPDASGETEGGNPAPAGTNLLAHLTRPEVRIIVERTDRAVLEGRTNRDWIWGPNAITPPITEPYVTLPDGVRTVQYFDKGRLEVVETDEREWPVTAGLLVLELTSGRVQLGDDEFEERLPAEISIVEAAPDGPTYADLDAVADLPPPDENEAITVHLLPNGDVADAPILATRAMRVIKPAGSGAHSIAEPFWHFMTAAGTIYEDGSFRSGPLFIDPYFATGRPVTEPFWIGIAGSDSPGDLLVQCFERRCLTYAPVGGAEWRVQSNDVGRHYFRWRYGVSGTATVDSSG